jgi:hypothetical protein
MKTSRLAQSVISHSLIIVRESGLMQGIVAADHGKVEHWIARKSKSESLSAEKVQRAQRMFPPTLASSGFC